MESTMTRKAPLYLSDLMTGVFAALAKKGVHELPAKQYRMDEAFARLFDDLKPMAEQEGLSLRFRINTHPLHGESEDVQQELTAAAKRDLISLQNPQYVDVSIKISPDDADSYLSSVPGSAQMYEVLASKFISYYRNL